MTRPSPIRDKLRQIAPTQAKAQTDLIAALNHREIEGLRTVARVATERDRRAATAWIQFSSRLGKLAVAPLLVDGTLARMTSRHGQPDGVAAAATLGRIETLAAAAEAIFGLELHPAGLDVAPPDDAVLLCLDANDARGSIVHRLLIAAPADIAVEPLPLPDALPTTLAALRLNWSARVAVLAPRAERLASLQRGDLVLLGIGPFTATLSLPGRNNRASATLDWQARRMQLNQDPQQGEARVDDGTEAKTSVSQALGNHSDSPEWGDLRIPVAVEFDGAGLSAGEMATLGEGSVLSLPSQAGTLPVRILAGETVIADGELVAVGDGFGVLVTALRNAGN